MILINYFNDTFLELKDRNLKTGINQKIGN